MKFDDRFLDELKSRLRLSDVIGRTVKLRRQGREYVGLSPFSKEKSPSFFVNDDKGFFHDFSSGKHGDLIGFLQETERLTFREAVERLAAEAGMALPVEDPRAAEREQQRQGLQDWLETAAKWFEGELKRPAGAAARDYLARRGLPEKDWARFGLGFAPSGRTGLKDYLVAKGAKPGELVEAGLLIAPEDGGSPYDRFRDRIIFPITDSRGRVISFGGRAMDPEARAKYLNGPETAVFHKGSTLYGMAEARKLLHTGGEGAALVVVEGYMDVIACQRAGIAAVAAMGTALTEEQMAALWRLHPEPTLCFDNDAAGQRAASRTLDRALPLLKPGRSFKFALGAGGKDPDEILREHGAEFLKEQISRTIPFVQALFERERDFEPLITPESRAGFKIRLRRYASLIDDRDLSEFYRADLTDLLFDHIRSLRFGGVQFNTSTRRSSNSVNPTELLKDRIRTFSAAVAVGAIENPIWVLPYDEQLSVNGFGDKWLNILVQPLVDGLLEPDPSEIRIMAKIRAEGPAALEAFEYAMKYAVEVDSYPFVRRKAAPDLAKMLWVRSFELLMRLVGAEVEFAERQNLVRQKEPLALTQTGFVGRGRDLNEIIRSTRAEISAGDVWGKWA